MVDRGLFIWSIFSTWQADNHGHMFRLSDSKMNLEFPSGQPLVSSPVYIDSLNEDKMIIIVTNYILHDFTDNGAFILVEHPWKIRVNVSIESTRIEAITATKQSTTKPCAYFMGYSLHVMDWQPAVHFTYMCPDSKVHGADMGPTWGRQDPGGPHVGLMNFAIWVPVTI